MRHFKFYLVNVWALPAYSSYRRFVFFRVWTLRFFTSEPTVITIMYPDNGLRRASQINSSSTLHHTTSNAGKKIFYLKNFCSFIKIYDGFRNHAMTPEIFRRHLCVWIDLEKNLKLYNKTLDAVKYIHKK